MVARAIREIVNDDLPTAIQPQMVADVIVKQLLDHMGLPDAPRQMKAIYLDAVVDELKDGQLRAGCQRYTQETGHPHVPVTAYFFSNVYCDDAVLRECIARGALTTQEVNASLPRRSSYAKLHDGTLDRDEVIDNSTAGFLIFPARSDSPLLLTWMSKLRDAGIGSARTRMIRVAGAVSPDRLPAVSGAIAVLEQLTPRPEDPEYRQ